MEEKVLKGREVKGEGKVEGKALKGDGKGKHWGEEWRRDRGGRH